MLDHLLENFRTFVIGSVLVVVVVSRINRTLGSGLGLLVIGAIGILGTLSTNGGGAVGLATTPVSRPVFYGLCIVLAVLNLTALRVSLAQKRPRLPSDTPPSP